MKSFLLGQRFHLDHWLSLFLLQPGLLLRLNYLLTSFFIIFRHFPADSSQSLTRVLVILSHFLKHLHKRWYLDLVTLFRCLNPKKRRLPITVEDSFDHEVLLFIDEALAEFFKFLVARGFLWLTNFDVLAGGNLSFFENSFFFDVCSYLVIVNKRVVFSDFPHKVFSILVLGTLG